MRVLLTMWRREWSAYFLTPMAYVVAVFFLFIMGLSFGMLIHVLAQGPSSEGVMRVLFGESLFFWLALLMIVPAATMRLFAEEKRAGTIETLLTAPVSDVTVVLAKYLGALSFFIALWTPTVAYALLLEWIVPDAQPTDWGALGTTYIGVGCIGAFYISVGLYTSSLARNQAVAGVMCFAIVSALFFAGFMPYYARVPWAQELGRYMSAVIHMVEFSRGVLDTRPFVWYGSMTALLLFATVKSVESRKWKS